MESTTTDTRLGEREFPFVTGLLGTPADRHRTGASRGRATIRVWMKVFLNRR